MFLSAAAATAAAVGGTGEEKSDHTHINHAVHRVGGDGAAAGLTAHKAVVEVADRHTGEGEEKGAKKRSDADRLSLLS